MFLVGCSGANSKRSGGVKISEIVARIETRKQATIALITVDEDSRKKPGYVSWEAKVGAVIFEAPISSIPYVLDLGSLRIEHLSGQVIVDKGWLAKKTLKVSTVYHGQENTFDMSVVGKSSDPLVAFIENHEIDRKFLVVIVNL